VPPQPTPKTPEGRSSTTRETNSPAARPIWARHLHRVVRRRHHHGILKAESVDQCRSSRTQLSRRELMVMLTRPLLRASTSSRLTRSRVIFSRSAISAWVSPSM
jgi:hypothetical protein